MLLPKKEFNRITLRTMCCEEDKTNTSIDEGLKAYPLSRETTQENAFRTIRCSHNRKKRKDTNATYPESALAHSEEMSRVKILVVEDLKAWIST
jgi:hypothetical protein